VVCDPCAVRSRRVDVVAAVVRRVGRWVVVTVRRRRSSSRSGIVVVGWWVQRVVVVIAMVTDVAVEGRGGRQVVVVLDSVGS
jgi:hypothetical protein